jgi:hypothetical protein
MQNKISKINRWSQTSAILASAVCLSAAVSAQTSASQPITAPTAPAAAPTAPTAAAAPAAAPAPKYDTANMQHPKALKLKQQKPISTNWLLDADDDSERFRRLQMYLAGSQVPMWDVSTRYQRIYEAIGDKNYELANYHWEKLIDRLNGALMKRPNRTASAETYFLDPLNQMFRDVLKTKDDAKIKEAYGTVRASCMGCHAAEKMPFLNDQAVFRQTEKFAVVKTMTKKK